MILPMRQENRKRSGQVVIIVGPPAASFDLFGRALVQLERRFVSTLTVIRVALNTDCDDQSVQALIIKSRETMISRLVRFEHQTTFEDSDEQRNRARRRVSFADDFLTPYAILTLACETRRLVCIMR